MTAWVVVGVAFYAAVFFLAWALCRAAALADKR